MGIRLVVAGEYALSVEMLAQCLDTVPDFSVEGVVKGRKELLPTVMRVKPTVAVIEENAVDDEALTTLTELHRMQPGCGVALIDAQPTRVFTDEAIRAGVLGVVSKQAELTYLIGAIRGAAAGCLTMDPGLFGPPQGSPRGSPLSVREADVLRLTVSGASLKEIARDLYLAAGTVRNLASTAIRKLDARNRFDAARIAAEQNWI